MTFKRLDKVEYEGCVAYIHHISEEGFTLTLWLYGVPDEKRRFVTWHEPVKRDDFLFIKKLNRKTDFNEWVNGKVGIDHLATEDEDILKNLCIKNNVNISEADIECYYKRLWFILNNKLYTVQTILEAKECGVKKIYSDFLEYIYNNEM